MKKSEIKAQLLHPTEEMYMMIKEFNPVLLRYENMFNAWLDICCKFAENYDVPLKEWVEKKPTFWFSR